MHKTHKDWQIIGFIFLDGANAFGPPRVHYIWEWYDREARAGSGIASEI